MITPRAPRTSFVNKILYCSKNSLMKWIVKIFIANNSIYVIKNFI